MTPLLKANSTLIMDGNKPQNLLESPLEPETKQEAATLKGTPKKFLDSNLSKLNDSVSVSAISTQSTRN